MLQLIPVVQAPSLNPIFTPLEKIQLEKLGISQTPEGQWLLPDGRKILSKPLRREVKTQLYRGSNWGTQAMCDTILRAYVCPGIYTLVKQVTESCLTCRKVSKQALRGQLTGGRNPGFQSIQVDYTELPQWSLKMLTIYSRSSNQLGRGYASIKCHCKWSSHSTFG
jgi:hypothetical protein